MTQTLKQPQPQSFHSKLNNFFEPIDRVLGPSRQKHQVACLQDQQILLECVMKSPCYKDTQNFKHCMQEGISKECKALRYNYYMCKRSQIYWAKAFTTQNTRRI